jgi:hypothetical protein
LKWGYEWRRHEVIERQNINLELEMEVVRKAPCVILDTNVWLKERLLRDGVGKALIRSLKQQGGCIGLPEIVERELSRNVQKEGLRQIKAYSDSSRAIGDFTGSKHHHGLVLPTAHDFVNGLHDRLRELEPLLSRIPFSHAHSKLALDRVMEKLPPSLPNNDEFRDCAIWEAAVDLATSFDVHLVSNDKGFCAYRVDSEGHHM